MSNLTETKLSSETIYDGKVVHLTRDRVTLPNGREATREVIRHSGAVCIVPLTDENEVILVRQFRYPFGCTLLEIPAGKLDIGESPEQCAARELSEETGAVAGKLTYLGKYYPSVAYLNEVIHMYLAEQLRYGDAHTDDDEFLETVRIPLDTLVRRIMQGDVPDGKTQCAVLKALHVKHTGAK